MVAPDMERINGIRGWLLGLCFLLIVYQPFSLALDASSALDALPIRGLTLGLVLGARLIVAAVGVAAGLALLGAPARGCRVGQRLPRVVRGDGPVRLRDAVCSQQPDAGNHAVLRGGIVDLLRRLAGVPDSIAARPSDVRGVADQ